MAFSPSRSKTRHHARSISLPSRSHPLILQLNEHLCRLRSSEATCLTLSLVSSRLSGLEDLYDSIEDLLMSSHSQQAFGQERSEKWVDEVLDGYLIGLLDACATTKDVLAHMKQNAQQLVSILRRRRGENDDLSWYLASRKQAKKVIQKSLKGLKSIRNKNTPLGLDKDIETVAIVSMLNEVEEVTLAVLESILSYIAGTKQPSWSLISKLRHPKGRESKQEETLINEFDKVEAALNSCGGHKTIKSDANMNAENLHNHLVKLESSVEDLGEGLECLFRRLIKTRVSLLNILSH
ncbi:unnamed protein product [Ilex paraguariensis]|uniref:Uncharacterized protein n=1 Tax=Ilex paraguariensis TaxID=185542 RepID=A0ABC8SDN3_9AQUA